MQMARFIFRLFKAAREPARSNAVRRLLPWGQYSKGTDEQLVNDFIIRTYTSGVDWTGIWMPAMENLPWQLLGAKLDKDPDFKGQVWAPVKKDTVAFVGGGLGLLPNTLRTVSYLQRGPLVDDVPADLRRFFADNPVAMGWGRAVTQCGDFYPSLSQVGGGLWQQVMCVGSPQMYTVDASAVKSAWSDFFDAFFTSGFDYYLASSPSIGELLAPLIATVITRDGVDDVRLGIPNMYRPHPAPFVTPDIFKSGPGTTKTRIECLWIEEDLPKQRGPDGNELPWPHVAQVGADPPRYPKQHPNVNLRVGTYTDPDGFAVSGAYMWQATRGGPTLPLSTNVPKGYRCVPWPTPQELLTSYRRPDEVITSPACDRLAELQLRCLEETLVCAYVRPDDVGDLPAFGAFKGPKGSPGAKLAAKCREMRDVLLGHEARYLVILKDVDPIDPVFAKKLRASGVTNSMAQRNSNLQKIAAMASGPTGDSLPPPMHPVGSVAFDDIGPAPTGDPAPPISGRPSIGRAAGLFGLGYVAYRIALARGARP